MKCDVYEKFKLGRVGSRTWCGSGCSTIQLSLVKQHEKSDDHKWSYQRWLAKHRPSSKELVASIELGLQTMVDCEKERILTIMKFLYFVVAMIVHSLVEALLLRDIYYTLHSIFSDTFVNRFISNTNWSSSVCSDRNLSLMLS